MLLEMFTLTDLPSFPGRSKPSEWIIACELKPLIEHSRPFGTELSHNFEPYKRTSWNKKNYKGKNICIYKTVKIIPKPYTDMLFSVYFCTWELFLVLF